MWSKFENGSSAKHPSMLSPLKIIIPFLFLCAYQHFQMTRGLTSHNSHIQNVDTNDSSYTFASLLSLVEYSFTVSIIAGPFQSQAVFEGRPSPPVSIITPATCKFNNIVNSTVSKTFSALRFCVFFCKLQTSVAWP